MSTLYSADGPAADSGTVLGFSQVLGRPRLRQLRSTYVRRRARAQRSPRAPADRTAAWAASTSCSRGAWRGWPREHRLAGSAFASHRRRCAGSDPPRITMAAATILRSCGARAPAGCTVPPATRPHRRSADDLDGVVVEGFAETYEGSGFVVRHGPRVRGDELLSERRCDLARRRPSRARVQTTHAAT